MGLLQNIDIPFVFVFESKAMVFWRFCDANLANTCNCHKLGLPYIGWLQVLQGQPFQTLKLSKNRTQTFWFSLGLGMSTFPKSLLSHISNMKCMCFIRLQAFQTGRGKIDTLQSLQRLPPSSFSLSLYPSVSTTKKKREKEGERERERERARER